MIQEVENIPQMPDYLKQYITQQDYSMYTAIDHACWRHIMRLNSYFFKDHAHSKYLEGLHEFGISIERVPKISEMDEKLKKYGWRAVGITGFIPAPEFLEMLAQSILPIACDMRKIEHIDYTPSPDIVHEAAGHAPIVADPGYANLLHKIGKVARYAIYAKEDNMVYEAVLKLSETKEDPHSTEKDIQEAQEGLNTALKSVKYVSEAQKLTRFGWWSTEYGLFVDKNGKTLIYGAGLLSSVGESYFCLNPEVKKVQMTIDCMNQDFDITKPQPQLFYTDDFSKLDAIVDEFSKTMAYKIGGVAALNKALEARTVTTTQLDSGLQISGTLVDYKTNSQGEIIFLKYTGSCQLSKEELQYVGHGANYHKEGYSTPLGVIKSVNKTSSQLTNEDLKNLGFVEGKKSKLEFYSGIVVTGVLSSVLLHQGKLHVITFKDCEVKWNEQVLFAPEWGDFDMACGSEVVSVFGGAADRDAFVKETIGMCSKARVQKCNLIDENKSLVTMYQQVRDLREQNLWNKDVEHSIRQIATKLDQQYPLDWLLRFEILEFLKLNNSKTDLVEKLIAQLNQLSKNAPNIKMLIDRGFKLLVS